MTTLAPPDTRTAVEAPAPKRWRLTWNGRMYREEDLTVQHATIVAGITGRDAWSALDVLNPMTGPLHAAHVLSAFLIAERCANVDEDAAADVITSTVAEVSAVPVAQLLDAISVG